VDVQRMSQYLGEYRKNGEDEVLYHLEKGMLHHLNQDWRKSSAHFQAADQAIRKNYTKSINRNLQSMVANDLQLAYSGEPYEDVYLNVFQCLNYLKEDDFEGALVEARQFNKELEFISDRYKGIAESLSPDTAQAALDTVDAKLEGVHLLHEEKEEGAPIEIQQNSALARLIATVLYAKDGAMDDAEIAFNNLRTALDDQGQTSFLSSFSARNDASGRRAAAAETLMQPDAYNTLLVAFHGEAPRKEEKRYQFTFEIDEEEIQLDFAVPLLLLPGTQVEHVRAVVAHDTLRLPVIEEMQKTAEAMFQEKKPILYTRAVIRSVLKAGMTEGSQAAAEKEGGDNAAWLMEKISEHASEYMAQADTRGWQTMPAVSRAMVAQLPPGTHEVTFEYVAYDGTVLKERTRQIRVEGADDLALGESFYLR
jgi:hypothetical protein